MKHEQLSAWAMQIIDTLRKTEFGVDIAERIAHHGGGIVIPDHVEVSIKELLVSNGFEVKVNWFGTTLSFGKHAARGLLIRSESYLADNQRILSLYNFHC